MGTEKLSKNIDLYKTVNLWDSNYLVLEAADIEEQNFEFPWDLYDFLNVRKRGIYEGLGIVGCADDISQQGQLLAYVISSENKIENIAVRENYQRQGLGRRLIKEVRKEKDKLEVYVRETNLPAQLFFRELGFLAQKERAERYKEVPEEEVYIMTSQAPKKWGHQVKNRISSFYQD